ncbi:MAG: glycosyltransferase [Acetobacteraceae bacterium]
MSAEPGPAGLCSVFATFAVGGPQRRFVALANRFAGRYRHRIVAMDGNTAARDLLRADAGCEFPPIDVAKRATLANRARYRAALRAWTPDLLVTNNWGSIEWAMADLPRLVPHLHIEDGFGPEEQNRQLPRRVLTRRLVLRWSRVVVPSRTLFDIATTVWRLPPARVHYIPNGIDLAPYAATAPAPLPEPSPGTVVIGTVAALRAEKNLVRLLDAFRRVLDQRPALLVIVGEGAEQGRLRAHAAALGLADRVLFPGHAASPAGWYRRFDLFALSSDTEQMPLAVIEAMAAGLPIAATDVGDVRRMLAAANAPYVVARDAEALAGAMLALAADPELRAALGAANRAEAARSYDQETMFAAYAALFDATIGPARQASQAYQSPPIYS